MLIVLFIREIFSCLRLLKTEDDPPPMFIVLFIRETFTFVYDYWHKHDPRPRLLSFSLGKCSLFFMIAENYKCDPRPIFTVLFLREIFSRLRLTGKLRRPTAYIYCPFHKGNVHCCLRFPKTKYVPRPMLISLFLKEMFTVVYDYWKLKTTHDLYLLPFS